MLGLMTCAPGIDPFTGLPLFTPAACAPPPSKPKPEPKSSAVDTYNVPSNYLVIRVRDYYSGAILFVTPCSEGFAPSWKASFEFDEVRRLGFELLALDTPHTRYDALDDGIQKIAGCDAYVSRMDEMNGLLNMKSAVQSDNGDDVLLQSQLKFRIKYHVVGDLGDAEAAAFGADAHDADTCSMTSSWSMSTSDSLSVCYKVKSAAAATLDTCSLTSSADASGYDSEDTDADGRNSVSCSLTSSASTQDHPAWWWSSNDSDAASTCSMTSSDSTGIVALSGTLTIESAVLAARDMTPWVDSVKKDVSQLIVDGDYDGVASVIDSLANALKLAAQEAPRYISASEHVRSEMACQLRRLRESNRKLADEKHARDSYFNNLIGYTTASVGGLTECGWRIVMYNMCSENGADGAPPWVKDTSFPVPLDVIRMFSFKYPKICISDILTF